jgi:hypothetical protein
MILYANVRELYAQSLFDKASVVYTAGGVKASKAYSVKGTDFTVTRAGVKNVVNRAGVLTEIPANTPATEFVNGVLKGTLIEPARTNFLRRSEEFDDASWTKTGLNTTGTPPWINVAVAPDGTTTADKLVENTSNSVHGVTQSVTDFPDNTPIALSIFAKASERTRIWIESRTKNTTFSRSDFDLSSGTVVGNSGGAVGSIEAYPNGWYKCTITVPSSNTGAAFVYLAAGLIESGSIRSYTGDGTSGVFIWGAQLETGSVATSYIRTTDTAITQPADVITATGVSGLIGQTEGTLYAEVDVSNFNLNGRVIAISDGTANNRVNIFFTTTNRFRVLVTTGGSGQLAINSSTFTAGSFKIAVAYAQSDFAIYINGVQVAVQASGSVPACSNAYLGGAEDGTQNYLNDPLSEAYVFPTRLTNAELETLTTP